MKKINLIVLIVLMLIGSTAVLAQQNVTIEQVFVELRPEYDTPDILIVYTIFLSEDLDYPVDLSASSGGPSVVWEVVDGSPVETTFDTIEEGEWISVDIKAETPIVYVDFYDPELKSQNSTISYTYNYPPGLKSELVDLAIWQPPLTENFTASDQFPETFEDEIGIIYHMASLNPDELDSYEIDFSYESVPVSENDPGSEFSLTDALPWALGIMGLGILAMGIYNLLSSSGTKVKTSKKKYDNKSKHSYGKKNKFCHSCGAKISGKDKFCSECGAKTR